MKTNMENQAFFISLVRDDKLNVDSNGSVWNPKTDKTYNTTSPHGYIAIGWRDGDKVRHFFAHRLVHLVYNGDLNEDDQVNHKDGNKRNNDPNNLEKVTNAENIQHAMDTGLISRKNISDGQLRRYKTGRGSGNKLSDDQVREIRIRYPQENISHRALAKEYGLNHAQITRLLSGEHYKNVSMAKQENAEALKPSGETLAGSCPATHTS